MKNADTIEKQPLAKKKKPKYIQRMHDTNQKAPLPGNTIKKKLIFNVPITLAILGKKPTLGRIYLFFTIYLKH